MARLTQHWHRIEVTGFGPFPFDMLRQDQCFPIYQSDTAIMRHPADEEQIVALGRWAHSKWEPNRNHWAAYKWPVTHHKVMR